MHPEAYDFVRHALGEISVLEVGSLNVNGTVRDLLPHVNWIGIDRIAGAGVDIVADGATFDTPYRFDLIICCEVFEHAENWRTIVSNISRLLNSTGRFIGTAAGPGREAHLCSGQPMPDPPTEWYENIDPIELEAVLRSRFRVVRVEHRGKDVRWFASGSMAITTHQS